MDNNQLCFEAQGATLTFIATIVMVPMLADLAFVLMVVDELQGTHAKGNMSQLAHDMYIYIWYTYLCESLHAIIK